MTDELDGSKQYPLGVKYPGVYFNEREAEIMVALLGGRSVVDIAEELNCSLRTIDFYITNMMKTLSCKSVIKLIACVRETDFMKYF